LPLAWSAVALADPTSTPSRRLAPPMQAKPNQVFNIATQTIAPFGQPTEATLVNGSLPGPTLRYREGDMLRVLVNNQLAAPTTNHWHGIILPNYMDGVPDVTQLPIAPGTSVMYEYPLRQSGTYWYHSHYQFQEQTGLSGPLIIEARDEPHAYDHDVIIFLADWLNQQPDTVVPQLRKEQPPTAATKTVPPGGFTLPDGKPFEVDVNYPGYLMNGHTNDNPWSLKVRQGDRLRLRFINGSAATFFRVSLANHELRLIASDGQPIVPLTVDSLVIGTAERYDALVTVEAAGSFTLHAAALGASGQALGVIHTTRRPRRPNPKPPAFDGPTAGFTNYAALKSPYPTTLPDGPVRTFTIDLGGQMKKYLWSMEGQYYPELYVPDGDGNAQPLNIRAGERVRIRFTNSTMMYHPMHLHGHFFRLLPGPGQWDAANAPLKDSLAVGPRQKIDIEFYADNPGRWFFHCHNLYHLAAGMARVVQYIT
jgi:multicopper oxidase